MAQVLDRDTVRSIAEDYGVETLDKEAAGVDTLAKKMQADPDAEEDPNKQWRPPVVTVMGHVDHGKVGDPRHAPAARVGIYALRHACYLAVPVSCGQASSDLVLPSVLTCHPDGITRFRSGPSWAVSCASRCSMHIKGSTFSAMLTSSPPHHARSCPRSDHTPQLQSRPNAAHP